MNTHTSPTTQFADKLILAADDMNKENGERWEILVYVRDTQETPSIAHPGALSNRSSMRMANADMSSLHIYDQEITANLKALQKRHQNP
jgi:molybdate-binding protein